MWPGAGGGRLLGWLEREAFDYDYYAEAQLHDGTLKLDDYEVLAVCSSRVLDARHVFQVEAMGVGARRTTDVSRRNG
jgi:hypothetical protein